MKNILREDVLGSVLKSIDKNNGLLKLILTGSKGKLTNF